MAEPGRTQSRQMDLGESLAYLMGDTGGIQEVMGGFRIKIYHVRGFPWSDVCKMLVFAGFKVYVTHVKADLYIEASL